MQDSGLSFVFSNFVAAKDGSDSLQAAPIEVTSGSFYALNDDGYGEGPQIAELRLYGLDPEQANNGILYCDIRTADNTLVIRRAAYSSEYAEEDVLAYASGISAGQGSWTTLAPIRLTGGPHHPGVSGTIKFNWDWAFTDTFIRLFVPLSTRVPLIVDDEDFTISAMELEGVTSENSDNGVLHWLINEGGTSYFALMNLATDTLVASAPITSFYAPLELELMPENGSGISGRVTLESTETDNSGVVVVRVNDGIRIPPLKGTGTRALAVDPDGRLMILP